MSFVNLMFPLSALRSETVTWHRLGIRIYAKPPGFQPHEKPNSADTEATSSLDFVEASVALELEPVTHDPWDVALPRPPEGGLIARCCTQSSAPSKRAGADSVG